MSTDGSVASMTLPDGGTQTVNTQDADTQAPTNVTRLDGQHQSQAISPTGQTTSQSGAGVTPATYGYDAITGQLASLTIFPSGSSTDTTGQEATGWKYGLSTGLLSTKTYADGSTDSFTYNNKLQLSAENLRGDSASFNYNSAGMQTGATYIGGDTETTIYDSLGTLDDLGRSHVMTEVTTSAGGQSTSTSDVLSYNPQGQVATEAQATGVNVHYDYNADSSIEDMKLYQNGQVISETDYAYDPISKRLQTITINGTTYTYTYKTNTNLVSSVATSANTVSYGYESNTGRLQSITATSSSSTDYSAGYTYTDNDQRLTENVLQENPDTQAIEQRNWTFAYDDQDELASVSQDGSTLYSYSYDGVGNRTDVGSVNAMNQYGSFQYNGRGDVTDDGQFSYTWDAKDRLTSVTPDSPDVQSQQVKFTYDPENRRTQEDIYNWDSGNQAWAYASSLKFVYNGSQMVAELDGQNQLLQTYTWGPTGTLLSITDYSGGTVKNYQVVTDGSGNVVELLDSSTGLVGASYQYDPWANPLSATGPAANVSPFRWQGEFYDASFGGYYMGAREGSARLHIFLSPDPSGEGSDDNLYRDVGNDPINEEDSTGLAGESVYAAEGRVSGAAIEERLKALNAGSDNQVGISRIYKGVEQPGTADMDINGIYSEVGPASPTGVSAKLDQMNGIPARVRGDAYLYRQMVSVPRAGGQVEYVKLTYGQLQALNTQASAGNFNSDQVWAQAKALAGNTETATVSEAAAKQGTEFYARGIKIVTGETAPEGAVEGGPEGEIGGGAAGVVAKGIAIVSVFLTLKDALAAAGVNGTKYQETDAPYYFTGSEGSVFTIQNPGFISQLWSSPQRAYVAGPKAGTTESITTAQRNAYQQQAEVKFGKLIPGGIFSNPKFIPGTERQTLPIYDPVSGKQTGWVDQNGPHEYPQGMNSRAI